MTRDRVRVAALTAPGTVEVLEVPRPSVGDDDALLRVEACGLCGTDLEMLAGGAESVLGYEYPVVPGHEPVGVIDEIGPVAAARWGVEVGDRVAVEPAIPCGRCRACLSGHYTTCGGWGRNMSYGFIGLDEGSGLWGGFAEVMHLHPNTLVHRVPDGVPPELAVLFNPLGAGVRWASTVPRLQIGDTVVVLGAGQRGLACVVAARAAGAGTVVVTGLSRDRHKLDLALALGADAVVDVEEEDVLAAVPAALGDRPADVVIEATPHAVTVLADAVDLVRDGGTIVMAGLKGGRPVEGLVTDKIVLRDLVLHGVRGVDSPAYRQALEILASGRFDLAALSTHHFGLEDVPLAMDVLAGRVAGEQAINVTVRPG